MAQIRNIIEQQRLGNEYFKGLFQKYMTLFSGLMVYNSGGHSFFEIFEEDFIVNGIMKWFEDLKAQGRNNVQTDNNTKNVDTNLIHRMIHFHDLHDSLNHDKNSDPYTNRQYAGHKPTICF